MGVKTVLSQVRIKLKQNLSVTKSKCVIGLDWSCELEMVHIGAFSSMLTKEDSQATDLLG